MSEDELKKLKDQLIVDEGNEDKIYEIDGKPHFGIGHLVKKGDPEFGKPVGTPVSEERIDEAFKEDVEQALKDLYKWLQPECNCNNLPEEVKQILANMIFNIGRTKMKGFKELKKAICAQDWKKAAEEMKDSEWYKQTKKRAKRLVKRMKEVN